MSIFSCKAFGVFEHNQCDLYSRLFTRKAVFVLLFLNWLKHFLVSISGIHCLWHLDSFGMVSVICHISQLWKIHSLPWTYLFNLSFFSFVFFFSSPQMGICNYFVFSSINNYFMAHLRRGRQQEVLPRAEAWVPQATLKGQSRWNCGFLKESWSAFASRKLGWVCVLWKSEMECKQWRIISEINAQSEWRKTGKGSGLSCHAMAVQEGSYRSTGPGCRWDAGQTAEVWLDAGQRVRQKAAPRGIIWVN